MPLDQHANRVSDIKEGRRDIIKNPEETEQEHKGIDTRDIDSSPRRRSKSCTEIRLWCLRLCRAKKRYSERVLEKPARRIFERIKARSKECEKPDDMAVAGVSTMPHREPISHRDAPKKSRSRKHDETVEVDEDVSRMERRRRKREEKKRKIMMEEEREKREWRKREERTPYFVDTRLVTRDDDLAVEDRIPVKPPPSIAELEKSCCYLCVQNTLAIAAVSRPEQSDKCVQVSAHKFHAETSPKLDKSSSPVLLVRTVQSSVKVRTRETSTLCPGTSMVPLGGTRPRTKKRKKFVVFPGLTRTKCPAGRYAACETDKSARRDDNAKKPELRCCREKNVWHVGNFAKLIRIN